MIKFFKLALILLFFVFKFSFCLIRETKDIFQQHNVARFLKKHPNIQLEYELGKGKDKIIYSVKDSNKVLAFFNDTEAFDREVEVLNTLKHKNIISIEYPDRECFSFYMDRAKLDLNTFLVSYEFESNQYDLSFILKLLVELIKGVKYIHEQGFVHRDLKPENILIFIDEQDNPILKITDFTLTIKAGSKEPCCGSPRYIEPTNFRLMRKSKKIECRFEHDIYSLAVIFYKIFYIYFKKSKEKDLSYCFRKNYLELKDTGFFEILNNLIKGRRISLENEHCRFPVMRDYISFIISKMWDPNLFERPCIESILNYIEQVRADLSEVDSLLQDPQKVYEKCRKEPIDRDVELELELDLETSSGSSFEYETSSDEYEIIL